MTDPREWCGDYGKVLLFARHLVSEHNFNATEILRYMEKPWNWTDEYLSFNRDTESCKGCKE